MLKNKFKHFVEKSLSVLEGFKGGVVTQSQIKFPTDLENTFFCFVLAWQPFKLEGVTIFNYYFCLKSEVGSYRSSSKLQIYI